MSVAPLDRTQETNTAGVVTRRHLSPRRRHQAPVGPQLDLRVRVIQRRSSSIGLAWSLRAVAVLGVYGLTSFVSTLAGQVAVESARRQEIAAKERAIAAAREESSLNDRVYALKSSEYVNGWAAAHRFVSPDVFENAPNSKAEGKRYVARR